MAEGNGSVTLPLSGWRFRLERQPDGTLLLFAGLASASEHLIRPRRLERQLVCGSHFEFKPRLLAREFTVIMWGMSAESVEIEALRKARGPLAVPVYRVGPEFWVTEARGRVRALRVKTNGVVRGDYGDKWRRVQRRYIQGRFRLAFRRRKGPNGDE